MSHKFAYNQKIENFVTLTNRIVKREKNIKENAI